MPTINAEDLGTVVLVEYEYEYKSNDGRSIKIVEGDEFVLIKKSNADWWQVIKQEQKKPFYVPAGYVRELPQKRFLDHPYFKKAHNALVRSEKQEKNKAEKPKKPVTKPRTKPLNDRNNSTEKQDSQKERMIVITGSREDLNVLSGFTDTNKFSEMRASTDSLDRFIENENPYDEVPFEPMLSPQERMMKIKQLKLNNVHESKENFTEDDPDYENIQNVMPSPRVREMTSSKHDFDTPKSQNKVMGNTPSDDQTDPPAQNIQKENSLPSFHSPKDSTCLKVMDGGWEKQVDNHTGNKYYYNSNTGEMRLTPPDLSKDFNSINIEVSPPMSPKDDSDKILSKKQNKGLLSDDEMKRPSLLQRRKTSPARFKNSNRITFGKKHRRKDQEESANINNNNSTKTFSIDLEKRIPSPREYKSLSPTRNWSSPVLERRKESLTSSNSNTSRSLSPDPLFSGWKRERGVDGETIFIHEFTNERWLELYDNSSGSKYYCNEATRITAWDLPKHEEEEDFPLPPDIQQEVTLRSDSSSPESPTRYPRRDMRNDIIVEEQPKAKTLDRNLLSDMKSQLEKEGGGHRKSSSLPWTVSVAASRFRDPPVPPSAKLKPKLKTSKSKSAFRQKQSQSMIILDDHYNVFDNEFSRPQEMASPQRATTIVPPPHPMIEKQGRLNWTKLVEAGKKMRKNWIQQWVVLLANNLLFYKDQKQATITKTSPLGKPESSCDLRGSLISWAKDKSSKKNVFHIKTVRGLQLLLQHDDIFLITEWYKSIESAIQKLNLRDPVDQSLLSRKESHGSSEEDDASKDKKKKDKKKEKKSKPPSRHGSDARNSDKVRSKLKKFIGRRPTMEMLQEKGYIKESVFGCPLQKLTEKENTLIPNFVHMCVEEVEKRGLDVDGIYRVSGNLSHVQSLRYKIDREQAVNLSAPEWEDIHVITGALKMFLRELPEPVIPFNFFDKFIETCKTTNNKQNTTKQLIKSLPKPNRETLKYLMNHFRNVVQHSKQNRMQEQNIAIVFGPTLLLKPPDIAHQNDPGGGNMAVYLMYQNQIIDYMLTEFNNLFV